MISEINKYEIWNYVLRGFESLSLRLAAFLGHIISERFALRDYKKIRREISNDRDLGIENPNWKIAHSETGEVIESKIIKEMTRKNTTIKVTTYPTWPVKNEKYAETTWSWGDGVVLSLKTSYIRTNKEQIKDKKTTNRETYIQGGKIYK